MALLSSSIFDLCVLVLLRPLRISLLVFLLSFLHFLFTCVVRCCCLNFAFVYIKMLLPNGVNSSRRSVRLVCACVCVVRTQSRPIFAAVFHWWFTLNSSLSFVSIGSKYSLALAQRTHIDRYIIKCRCSAMLFKSSFIPRHGVTILSCIRKYAHTRNSLLLERSVGASTHCTRILVSFLLLLLLAGLLSLLAVCTANTSVHRRGEQVFYSMNHHVCTLFLVEMWMDWMMGGCTC